MSIVVVRGAFVFTTTCRSRMGRFSSCFFLRSFHNRQFTRDRRAKKSTKYSERFVESFFEFVKINCEKVTVRRDSKIPMQKQVFPRHHSSFDLQSEISSLASYGAERQTWSLCKCIEINQSCTCSRNAQIKLILCNRQLCSWPAGGSKLLQKCSHVNALAVDSDKY